LPTPTITDPGEIAAALRDERVAGDAVVSLLEAAGIAIYDSDGSLVRKGFRTGPGDLWLLDDEVRGLIAMAEADAATISAGGKPATLGDLHAAIAGMVPDTDAAEMFAAYARSFDADPDALPARFMNGVTLKPETVVTRIHLWFLFVDGFVGLPVVAQTQTLVATRAKNLGVAGTNLPGLPFIPSADPRLDIREYPLMLAHLAVVGWLIPFDAAPGAAQVHEGHGGPGTPVSFRARHQPWYGSPIGFLTGQPLLLPALPLLDGLPVTWQSSNEAVLTAHGSLSVMLGVPTFTDFAGSVSLEYTPRREPGDQSGPIEAAAAILTASVSVRDLVTRHFQVPPSALGMLFGTRVMPMALAIEWHASGWFVDEASGGGRIRGQKCGDPPGDWVVTGTYDKGGMRGTQRWVFTIGPNGKTGTFTYHQDAKGRPGGSPVTIYTKGDAGGDVTLSFPDDGSAHMHLVEKTHTVTARTDVGGTGASQNVPVQESNLDWRPGGTCP
jgi:hypothetical protein